MCERETPVERSGPPKVLTPGQRQAPRGGEAWGEGKRARGGEHLSPRGARPSPGRPVYHHGGKAEHEPLSGYGSVSVGVHLGDERVPNDPDHGPRREGHGEGKEGPAVGHEEGAEEAGDGLNSARHLPVQERGPERGALAVEREGHGEALGKILRGGGRRGLRGPCTLWHQGLWDAPGCQCPMRD